MKIRLGTRGSMLALAQSEAVAKRLRAGGHQVELVRIVTEGDKRPIDTVPGDGIFVAAIERALLNGEIDIAVHSAKDVPLKEDAELVLAAYTERGDPRDALVTRIGLSSITALRPSSTVGTDSPRRAGFLRAARPDLSVVPLHGNVDTRLRRLDSGEVDALVLAASGLDRLGRGDRIDERLDPRVVPPAPAQGALVVQCRRNAGSVLELLAAHDQPEIRLAVEAERGVLRATGGSCRAPVGALASVDDGRFELLVGGVNSDGSDMHVESVSGKRSDAPAIAEAAGRRLSLAVQLR